MADLRVCSSPTGIVTWDKRKMESIKKGGPEKNIRRGMWVSGGLSQGVARGRGCGRLGPNPKEREKKKKKNDGRRGKHGRLSRESNYR